MIKDSVYGGMKPINSRLNTLKKSSFLSRVDAILRRLLDIVAASLGLVILSPTFLWIAFAIKRDSPGPVFYRGRRVGRGGKEFGILKFRTMYDDEKSHNGSKVTAQDDPRITPLGRKVA